MLIGSAILLENDIILVLQYQTQHISGSQFTQVDMSAYLLYCVFYLIAVPGSEFNIAGRIDSGHVQIGESVVILPVGETATVKSKLFNSFVNYILVLAWEGEWCVSSLMRSVVKGPIQHEAKPSAVSRS